MSFEQTFLSLQTEDGWNTDPWSPQPCWRGNQDHDKQQVLSDPGGETDLREGISQSGKWTELSDHGWVKLPHDILSVPWSKYILSLLEFFLTVFLAASPSINLDKWDFNQTLFQLQPWSVVGWLETENQILIFRQLSKSSCFPADGSCPEWKCQNFRFLKKSWLDWEWRNEWVCKDSMENCWGKMQEITKIHNSQRTDIQLHSQLCYR